MFNESESSTLWASVQNIAVRVLQIIDMRLALLIGLAAFMMAVGFDSSGNKAEAADLVTQASLVPVMVSAQVASPGNSFLEPSATGSDAQMAAARRLRHSKLTSAVITKNRLTEAHLFTDLSAR